MVPDTTRVSDRVYCSRKGIIQFSTDTFFLCILNMTTYRNHHRKTYTSIQTTGIHFLNEDKYVADVAQDGMRLEHLPLNCKKNSVIVWTAVHQNGLALQFASPEMKKSKVIVATAVHQNWFAILYADDTMKRDKDIATIAIEQNPDALEHTLLHDDYDIVLCAIKKDGEALRFASPRLQRNPQLALIAIRQSFAAFEYIDNDLKENLDIMIELVFANPRMITRVPYFMRDDVKRAVAQKKRTIGSRKTKRKRQN